VFPKAIFYAHNNSGSVSRFDVVGLELGSKPGEQSKAFITPCTQQRPKDKAKPILATFVVLTESWGKKYFALKTGGILELELGRYSRPSPLPPLARSHSAGQCWLIMC